MHFDPIIERNTVIPISRSNIYYPAHENQREVNIDIYQGENFFIDKNVFLGSFTIKLPKDLKNKAFDIRFTYDINGLLEVEATLHETKEKKQLIIEGNPGLLTKEELAKRLIELNKLKIHPREEIENKLVLAEAERLFMDLKGKERNQLSQYIQHFIKVINHQDPREILREREMLKSIIDSIKEEFI